MKSLRFNKEDKRIIGFLARVLGLYLLWYLVYDLWIFPDGRLDTWLSEQVAWAAALVLDACGFPSFSQGVTVLVNAQPTVIIGNPCNGMVLFGVFTGFIVAFPGLIIRKSLFILLGISILYLVNVLRVVILALNHIYSYSTVSFNHHYTFTFAVYGCIFLLWMLWVKKMSDPATPLSSLYGRS